MTTRGLRAPFFCGAPMPKSKKPNIFEQRRRKIDEASGWEDPPKPKAKKPVKPPKKRSY